MDTHMELKVRIGYEELLNLIQQLPQDQLLLLKKELDKFGKEKSDVGPSKLKELTLSGPVMSSNQYEYYQEFRAQLNNWREE